MIEIKILIFLKYALIYLGYYSMAWLLYRYIMYPNYKWHQRGNVCYSNAREFSMIVSTILFLLTVAIMNNVVVFRL